MITKTPKDKRHIATLYYRNTHLLVLTIVILLVGGLAAITNLPRLEDPRITQRAATILTFLPGASAERIEALVNEKIEDALEEISEIKHIESTARSNVSSITVELQDSVTTETNEEIFSKIRSRLQNVRGELPPDATIPFLDDERGVIAYSIVIGLSWDGAGDTPLNLLQRLALDLKDRMLNIPNTELVRIFGGVTEEITVFPDPDELAALNMRVETLARLIQAADSKISAGQVRGQGQDLRVEVDGALDGVARIAEIPVTSQASVTMLKVGDIAAIRRGYQTPPDQIGLKDQKRTIYVAIRADANVRLDQWDERAQKVIREFRADYDRRIGVEAIFNQNRYTESRLNDLVGNLVAGAVLVVLIVFLTMGWKAGIVVGSALPLSAGGAVFALNFFDEGIHQMSIFGMIIAIGLLIDSAIVMTDEVRKQIRRGQPPGQAMETAVRHLFVPLLASTFTTILGFMPIFLLPGNAGDFVSPIAVSVVMALCFSFFLAVTVIPALIAKTTSRHERGPARRWWRTGLPRPKIADDFQGFVIRALNRPRRYALLALVPVLIGFGLTATMPMEFFPPGDRDMFEIQLWKSSESAIAHTHATVAKADAHLKTIDGVVQIHWLIGASIPPVYYNQIPRQDNNSAFAQAVVVATSPQRAESMIIEAQNLLNAKLPEARSVVKTFAQGPPVDAPIEFRILGPDLDTLRGLGEKVRGVMHRFPEVIHSRASIEGGEPKLWFDADEAESDFANLDLRDIANQLQANLEGFTGGSILEDVEELPVRVRLTDAQRASVHTLASLPLTSAGLNRWIPSSALGTLALRPESGTITRFDGQRANTIFGYISPDAKAVSVSAAVMEAIREQITLPSGYRITVAGDSEQQKEAVANLLIYAPVLLVMMAATLILSFRSVALALIVGLVGIFSVGLGMLALKIAGYPLGFNPLIGSIGLTGVAINDTIVVLAAITSNHSAKHGHVPSIVDETFGCGRHVLSTTFTTIGGFIPLLLLSGGSFWPPLSVVIAGGIGFSLILAMFFTPLAYKIFADLKYGGSQRRGPQTASVGSIPSATSG
ncbi:MAG: efflux RND transporter permease subunit [Desulfobacterales bacterium]|nr:efflux RND transporter permease subunit [Desulfobacterales bacterium]